MKPKVAQSDWGRTKDGQAVELYTLTNRHGLVAKVTTFGATLTQLWAPDRHGVLGDIVLGFDELSPYLEAHPYFGSTVGRVAGRIAGGRFVLDGKTYELAKNDGASSLHGGLRGFDKVVWRAEVDQARGAVRFSYLSRSGEEGYPGALAVSIEYSLDDDGELRLDYLAETDAPTPVNLTNHSYFNLRGSGDVLAHELTLAADAFLGLGKGHLPTGETLAVDGTVMDFRRRRPLGEGLPELGGEPGGYDHTYVLRPACREGALAARVVEPQSGRVLEVYTTEPGIQLYTGNYLDGSSVGKGGWAYGKHHGFCLETQHFPDAVNQAAFPSVILRPGRCFRSTTRMRLQSEPS